jgi:hypothetical protein
MFSGADHALASLRESNLTLAIISQASALAIVASKSFARRRLRLSQAMVRSATQRRGNNLKPLAASDRLTISEQRELFREMSVLDNLRLGAFLIQAGISSHHPDVRPERLQRKTSLPAFSTTS